MTGNMIPLALLGVTLAICALGFVIALGHAMIAKEGRRTADALERIATAIEHMPYLP